nr:immunoglobulin light chain junction region [Macaca mulatta]
EYYYWLYYSGVQGLF